jgi:hypothetical protein
MDQHKGDICSSHNIIIAALDAAEIARELTAENY